MKTTWTAMLLAAGLFAQPAALKAEINLLASLDEGSLKRFTSNGPAAFLSKEDKSLTITFPYAPGDLELRIPVRAMGWPSDWSKYRAVRYTFHASSLEMIAVGFGDGKQTRLFITEPLPGIRIRGVIPFDAFVQTRAMVPMLPVGYKVWPQRLFTFEKVEEVVFRMRYPAAPAQFTLYEFTLTEEVPTDDILDRKPLIDRYGQWIPENWDDKAHNDEQLRKLWAADQLKPVSYPFCELGGDASRKRKATGFFRTERVDGRWMLVDPHGHPFFSTGMDLVGYQQSSFGTDVRRREFLYEQLPPPGPAWLTEGRVVSYYVWNIMRRYGDGWERKWTENILARLRNWGFNTVANWSDRDLAVNSRMPYVLPLSGWTTRKTFPFPYDFPDVFSKEFEENVEAAARRQVVPLKDDANLIGWFIGNEPRWARDFGALQSFAEMVLADPEPSATQAKLKQMLADNPGNEARIKEDFLFEAGRKYFETVHAAIRRHDPNHLNLGIRFAGRPDERWVKLHSIFDVFSINIYSASFAPDADLVRRQSELSGRPVMIGEFTACTPGRGLQGLFYNVHKVKDYRERGIAYRYYVENSAADPHIVGTHWFQMVDNLPTGRPSDAERLNYGFINVIDLPYADLVEAARQTHARIYGLSSGKLKPYSVKPRYH